MKGQVRIRISKQPNDRRAERLNLDLRTPSGRVLPY